MMGPPISQILYYSLGMLVVVLYQCLGVKCPVLSTQ